MPEEMDMTQKTVLLGVTGCVAIYKACEIVRGLQKAGMRVKVVMTQHASEFVKPAQFRALTREPVAVGLFDDAPGDPIHHVSLAKEADLFLIAPCTANVIAKIACGIADDLLTTTALATCAPIVIAPAMNVNMYENVATQNNIETLKLRGITIVEPDAGYLACGDTGRGRLADVEAIVEQVSCALDHNDDLEGRTVLVTAGPTIEPIDPVRFISNPSSGKMGYAIAEAARKRGAEVILVSGPVELAAPYGCETIYVKTALQMHEAVESRFDDADIAIFSAAVSDFRPVECSADKLKKGKDDSALMHLDLVANPDIIATVSARKKAGQIVIGFAAETRDVAEYARKKLHAKHADLIVGNLVGNDRGFGKDDNEVVIVGPATEKWLPRMSKRDIADAILDEAISIA